jgi:rubredoxin
MKQCSKCKEIKPKDEFCKDSKRKDGLESKCRSCGAVYQRERRERLKLKNAERTEFPETKRCPACGETKAGSEFSRNSNNADGLHSQCKACTAEYKTAYHVANKLHKAVKDGYRRAVALGNHAEEFIGDDLEAHWEVNGISKDHCHYCQVHFGALEQHEQQIDHVEALNTGGPHTVENIVPCCKSCNDSKNDRPLSVFQSVEA